MIRKYLKNNFIKNTLILIIGGFITKILGMLIKIIITRNINDTALGLYMLTIPTYNLFIVLCTQGMQISISKLISEEKINEKEILSTGIKLSIIISLIVIILIIILSKPIAFLLHNKNLYLPILSSILSIPFISITNILKGYFLGKNKMHIEVINNLFEQISRIIIFITILPKINNIIMQVTFIIASNLINEIISIIILSLFLDKKINLKDLKINNNIKKEILSISLPSTTSKIIGTISYFIEPIILTTMLTINGYNNNYITREYGIITGYSMQLLLLPSFFSLAISNSIIPLISNAYVNKKYKYIKNKINEIILLSSIIGISYISILLINPEFFLKLIYNTNKGVNYIKIMAPIFILLYIQTPLNSILQSINKSNILMISTIKGTIIKILLIIILSYLKLGMLSYILPMLINIIYITTKNYLSIRKEIKIWFNTNSY